MPEVGKLDVIEQLLDDNGALLAGGKVYTYQAGTTTPLATYVDSSGGSPNTNPLTLDASGRGDLWFAVGLAYKVVVQLPSGTVLKTVDGVKVASFAIDAPIILTWTGPQPTANLFLGGEAWRGPGVWTSNFAGAGGLTPDTETTDDYTVTIKKVVAGVKTTVGTAVRSGEAWTIEGTGGNDFSLDIDDQVKFYGSGDASIADFGLTIPGTVTE